MSDHTPDACGLCQGLLHRRTFIERSGAIAAAALLSLGVPKRALALLRPGAATVLRRHGHTVTYPLPTADGVQIDRSNEVILARWHGIVIAFNLACPHQRAPIRWLAEDNRFECPKHHSKYTPDGSYISGRATRALDRLAIARQGDTVSVDIDTIFKQTDQPEGWRKAQLDVS